MNRVVFDPDARTEFLTAVEYYENCQAGFGRQFRMTVEMKTECITEMPFRYRIFHAPFRRCLVPGFPYAIIFTIESGFILVVAVAHVKQKPGYWNNRNREA